MGGSETLSRFARAVELLKIIPKLGIGNCATVALYRFTIKIGLRRLLSPAGQPYPGPFFKVELPPRPQDFDPSWEKDLAERLHELKSGTFRYFAFHKFNVGSPPSWFTNPIQNTSVRSPNRHWTAYDPFDPSVGDIKVIWELSRFGWLLDLVRGAIVFKDASALELANALLSDWVAHNPVNIGPNWMNGQEAAFRVFHVLLAARLLGQHTSPTPALIQFVREHCARILRDIEYALAQTNNHGISEAAALFIGGVWLAANVKDKQASRWAQFGRRVFERTVKQLVERDGSFSQRSVTYHRVLLDTLWFVAYWRRELELPHASTALRQRKDAALNWLIAMTDELSGDAPNFGANDGSLICALHSGEYRDFRPTIQMAAALFREEAPFAPGPHDEPLCWLRPRYSRSAFEPKRTQRFLNGGYITLKGENSWGMVHAPCFRFRPSQADVFHFDLWFGGKNLLTDSGSYSYNADPTLTSHFASTAAHNTVQFDARNQMPRISRFLFGRWTSAETLDLKNTSWTGRFTDMWGCSHVRRIEMAGSSEWTIRDELHGHSRSAVIRWHLPLADWQMCTGECRSSLAVITIAGAADLALKEAESSLYYFERHRCAVLEVNAGVSPAHIETVIRLSR